MRRAYMATFTKRAADQTRDVCSVCGIAVWVAQSGRDILAANPDFAITCPACAIFGSTRRTVVSKVPRGTLRRN